MNGAKPYKVQKDSRKIGIVANNLEDLRTKAVLMLNLTGEHRIYLEDDTEVVSEDYFQYLPEQTCFTFSSRDGKLDLV